MSYIAIENQSAGREDAKVSCRVLESVPSVSNSEAQKRRTAKRLKVAWQVDPPQSVAILEGAIDAACLSPSSEAARVETAQKGKYL
jgi:hypothetical protein